MNGLLVSRLNARKTFEKCIILKQKDEVKVKVTETNMSIYVMHKSTVMRSLNVIA